MTRVALGEDGGAARRAADVAGGGLARDAACDEPARLADDLDLAVSNLHFVLCNYTVRFKSDLDFVESSNDSCDVAFQRRLAIVLAL